MKIKRHYLKLIYDLTIRNSKAKVKIDPSIVFTIPLWYDSGRFFQFKNVKCIENSEIIFSSSKNIQMRIHRIILSDVSQSKSFSFLFLFFFQVYSHIIATHKNCHEFGEFVRRWRIAHTVNLSLDSIRHKYNLRWSPDPNRVA